MLRREGGIAVSLYNNNTNNICSSKKDADDAPDDNVVRPVIGWKDSGGHFAWSLDESSCRRRRSSSGRSRSAGAAEAAAEAAGIKLLKPMEKVENKNNVKVSPFTQQQETKKERENEQP